MEQKNDRQNDCMTARVEPFYWKYDLCHGRSAVYHADGLVTGYYGHGLFLTGSSVEPFCKYF